MSSRSLASLMAGESIERWGAAEASPLGEEHERLLGWIRDGRSGSLAYMRERSEILRDPGHPSFLEGARSVVMAALPFATADPPVRSLASRVARHARGRDYHLVLGERLGRVLSDLRAVFPGLRGRVFVDSAPVMEKAWAQRAGLGWIGRSGLLVQPGLGTWFVLGGIAIDVPLDPGSPCPDGCGECRACIDACPASAIGEDRLVDARLCLSAVTIERRSHLTADRARLLGGRSAFGCDLCQEACPFNASPPRPDPGLEPLPSMIETTDAGFLALDPVAREALLAPTAIARTGAERLAECLAASIGRSR